MDCDLIFKLHNCLLGEKIILAKPGKSRSQWTNLFSIFLQRDLAVLLFIFFSPIQRINPCPQKYLYNQFRQLLITPSWLIYLWAASIRGTGDTARFGQGVTLGVYQGAVHSWGLQPCQTLGTHPTRMQVQLGTTHLGRVKVTTGLTQKKRCPWTAAWQPSEATPSTINKPVFILVAALLQKILIPAHRGERLRSIYAEIFLYNCLPPEWFSGLATLPRASICQPPSICFGYIGMPR